MIKKIGWTPHCLMVVAMLFVLGAIHGCGSDSVGTEGALIGGPCIEEEDCEVDSECLRDDNFPGGTCALPCALERHCPSGSSCVKHHETTGVCLLSCTINEECREDYECRGEERADGDGEVLVCAGE